MPSLASPKSSSIHLNNTERAMTYAIVAILFVLCAYNPAVAISQWLGLFSLEKNQTLAKIIQTINSAAVVVLLILTIILFDQLAMGEEIRW